MSPVPMKKKKVIDPFTVRKSRYTTIYRSPWIEACKGYDIFNVECVAAHSSGDGAFILDLAIELVKKGKK